MLVVTDGTQAGTVILKTFEQGFGSDFKVLNNSIYFIAGSSGTGLELWVSDGSVAGTHVVKDVCPGGCYGANGQLEILYNKLYFGASTNGSDYMMWESDGTEMGTQLFLPAPPLQVSSPGPFFCADGRLFFNTIHNGAVNPWVTDGTISGTYELISLPTMGAGILPEMLGSCNGKVFFTARPATSSYRTLYITDGTAAGTHPINAMSKVGHITCFNNKAYFSASDSSSSLNRELWASDGTTAGTYQMIEINSLGSSDPNSLTVFNNLLFFSANDGINGRELYISDGTAPGTYKPVFPNISAYDPVLENTYRSNFVEFNGSLYFTARYDSAGFELWKYSSWPAAISSAQVKNARLALYPNPATQSVNVNSDQIVRLSFINMVGQEILVGEASHNKFIDISPLQAGVYSVSCDGTRQSIKFIKR